MKQDSFDVESVGILLPRYFGQNQFVIVVPQRATHFVIVHVGSVFSLSPASSHFLRVQHPEFSACVFPSNAARISFGIIKELQKELPELNLARGWKNQNQSEFHI